MKTWTSLKTNFIILFLLLWSTHSMGMEKPITKEHKLQNGLKVVVREDHRAPVVVSQIWYKVGSSDEQRWITGISHALEHMMFQGTPALPGDGFAQLISRLGGQNNAFTAEDYTAFYEELDATHLPVSFQAEAERMTKLSLVGELFAKEIKVVMEERRMRTDDNPQHFAWERFMAAANVMGPYHHPVVGWQQDLDHMTIEDLRSWYQQWYVPNNAVIVVVGDVKADEVFKLAEQHFGTIPARAVPTGRSYQEIAGVGEKRIKVQIPAKLPFLILGFDAPTLKTAIPEECYALFVASAVLDGGQSARFARNLMRGQQIAAQLDTSYDPFKKYATQFFIAGTPAQGHTVAELEAKIMEQIDILKTQLVSEAELQRVKTQVLAQQVFGKDSMASQATLLGMLEAVGLSWEIADTFPDKIKAVSAEQIQQVVKKYFHPKRLTVAELIPENVEPTATH
jgi:zinc protease